MKNDMLQLVILLGLGVSITWLMGPPLRVWEGLLVGTAVAIAIGAAWGALLVKGGFVRPSRLWGDGSLFRVAQAIGLAIFVYGSVRMSGILITVGALGFGVGSIGEFTRARLHRGA